MNYTFSCIAFEEDILLIHFADNRQETEYEKEHLVNRGFFTSATLAAIGHEKLILNLVECAQQHLSRTSHYSESVKIKI